MNDQDISPSRKATRTFLTFIVLFVVYAITVQVTDVNLDKLRNPDRQEQLVRVLRFLANPDLTDPDVLDRALGEETEPITTSETTQDTIRLIIETIFMALMATTIGTILAVPVSFLAARNLMAEITMPLASIMSGVIAFGIGAAATLLVTRYIVLGSDQISSNSIIGLITLFVIVGIFWILSRAGGTSIFTNERRTSRQTAAITGRFVLVLLFGISGLYLFGSLSGQGATWFAAQLKQSSNLQFLSFIGNFFIVIADTIRVLLTPTLVILAGLVTLSIGSRLGQEAVLSMEQKWARIVTLPVTAVGSAFIIFAIGYSLNWLYQFDNPSYWTTIPAIIGGILFGLLSLLLGPKRPFAIGQFIYAVSRSILNALRSIEPLIMAVVFVVWVGLGPFAGVMALALHTIAALGKLFSEQIEGISQGPIEAITATGANRLQVIVFGVIPQIVPLYIAYTLYRWDINVRMSTIIGFVGGGGIGFLLSQSIRLLRYREASVMMLAIAIVVSSLDYLSAKIRTRII